MESENRPIDYVNRLMQADNLQGLCPETGDPHDPFGLSAFDDLPVNPESLPLADLHEGEDPPPIVTFPKNYFPDLAQYFLGNLLLLSVVDGKIGYEYPHKLSAEYWQKPMHIFFEEKHVATIQEGRRSRVFVRLVEPEPQA